MFPDAPVFDQLRDSWDDRVTSWDLGKRPVPRRVSDASALDPETAIVAGCETTFFRALIREHPDPAAAEQIAEEQHQRDLERAAHPPVIEVTVTTPPGGIPRAELEQAVGQAVREFTGPQMVLADEFVVEPAGRGSRVLRAVRRRIRRRPPLPDSPPAPLPAVPVSEDDQPTVVMPAVVEVRLP